MNCGRCGGPIGNRVIRYNGVVLCENCARELGVDEAIRSQSTLFGQAFPMFEEMANTILGGESAIEFANTKIRCPRCKMTLREFETTGQAGCIECFNTFNETILKHILKRQGSSDYQGRKPGEISLIEIDEMSSDEVSPETIAKAPDSSDSIKTDSNEAPKAAVSKAEVDTNEIMNSDNLDNYSNEDLEAAMKKAAKEENYPLAMRIRDELKKRKGGN